MVFSNYICNWLREAEDYSQETLIKGLAKTVSSYNKELSKFILDNARSFAIKPKQKTILQYHKDDSQLHSSIISKLNQIGIPYKVESQIINVSVFLSFRKTGKDIIKYWGSNNNAKKDEIKMLDADKQEIGVLIWYYMLKNNLNNLNDPKLEKELIKNINVKNPAFIKETIKFLISNVKQWNTQCKKSAQVIIDKIPQLKQGRWELHQGGSLFDEVRRKGLILSGLPGAADKWNPSDIYFIKPGFKPSGYKTIVEYNAVFYDAKEIVGVSLKKGKEAGGATHGAISLSNLFKYIKAQAPKLDKINLNNGKLDDKGKKEVISLLKKVKDVARKFNGKVFVYDNKGKDHIRDLNVNVLLDRLYSKSPDWGISVPYTLQYLATLNSDQKWHDFTFLGYCIATSQTDVSAFHYKVEGSEFSEVNKNKLNSNLFDCKVCRIPLDGSTNVIFDAYYDEHPRKMQMRSKGAGSPPQMMIFKTKEKVTNLENILSWQGLE